MDADRLVPAHVCILRIQIGQRLASQRMAPKETAVNGGDGDDEGDQPRRGPVTLHDVAAAAGVHPSTVSRALDPSSHGRVNEQTRLRIAETAQELGYRPHLLARGLKGGRSGTVGVIVADLSNVFFAPIIRGIEKPQMSASSTPTVNPRAASAAARLTVTDDFPTPP